MKTSSEGFQQSYNAQTAVEGENQLVVGAGVTNNASDQGQLIPMIDGAEAVCGGTPGQVLADAGYGNEQDLRELEKRGVDGYVALGREGKAPAKIDPEKHPARARMADKLAMGFRRFSFRGLEKVQAEWTLVCLALNVKRLHTLQAA